MAETIESGCDGSSKWHWYNIQTDLVEQGGIEQRLINIDPLSIREHFCSGVYEQTTFCITWFHNMFMMLTMSKLDHRLVHAFSDVLEYEPAFFYIRDGVPCYEWDKHNPEHRLNELSNDENVKELRVFV